MKSPVFWLFLTWISFSGTCEFFTDCELCKSELCYFLKLFDGSFACSDRPSTTFSKYSVDYCDEIRSSFSAKVSNADPNIIEDNMNQIPESGPSSTMEKSKMTINHENEVTWLTNITLQHRDEWKSSKTKNIFLGGIFNSTTVTVGTEIPPTETQRELSSLEELNVENTTMEKHNSIMKTNARDLSSLNVGNTTKEEDSIVKKNVPDLSRFYEKLQRNFCHQMRLLKIFMIRHPSNSTIGKILTKNPMANDSILCFELIRLMREKRLSNCKSCTPQSEPKYDGLVSDLCSELLDCETCVTSGCTFIFNSLNSSCVNSVDPIPPGSTVIPAGGGVFCPSVPTPNPTVPTPEYEEGYRVGFWMLFTVTVSFILGKVAFYIRNQRKIRIRIPEEIPLTLV